MFDFLKRRREKHIDFNHRFTGDYKWLAMKLLNENDMKLVKVGDGTYHIKVKDAKVYGASKSIKIKDTLYTKRETKLAEVCISIDETKPIDIQNLAWKKIVGKLSGQKFYALMLDELNAWTFPIPKFAGAADLIVKYDLKG